MDSPLVAKNQFAALCCAMFAVMLFAVFEHGLTKVEESGTIDFYMTYRVVATAAMFFLLLGMVGRRSASGLAPYCWNPLDLRPIIWVRAVVTLLYQAALTIALVTGGTQASAYPLFLLHPLWQILAHRIIYKRWPDLSGRLVSLGLILAGVVVYALNPVGTRSIDRPVQSGFLVALSYFAALAAGAGFALTNELASAICDSKRSDVLRQTRGAGEKVSSLEVSAYTTYASLWLLPVMLPVIIFILQGYGLKSMWDEQLAMRLDSALFLELTVGCAIITAGTWLFTEAFKRATKGPQVAALDALILPIGIVLDVWSGKISVVSSAFVPMMASTILIVGGVFWSALQERRRTPVKATE